MRRQAIILAGGKGTRLRERLNGLPKPLVDVCGVPLLERQIELLKRYGFDRVVILVNHAAEQIVQFCRRRDNWGLDITFVDDGEPRGTAGATLAIEGLLAPEFLVVYGDTLLEVDLERFHAFHALTPDAAASLFLHPNDHPHDSDLIDLDQHGDIRGFFNTPHPAEQDLPNLVNAALYWVRRSALTPWVGEHREGVFDFARDLFPSMVHRGQRLRGYVSPEYIKDAGTPERLDRVCSDLRRGKVVRASLANPQPVIFLDRDGTINREVGYVRSRDQFELLPGVSDAIRRVNESDYRTCVITNQPVIARGETTFEELEGIHRRMSTVLGQSGAFIDRVYFCPHHPEAGFEGERRELKIKCDCRKPNTGLIEQAALDFNADLKSSWFVGDTTVDVETARRAGLRSILLETGHGGLDNRHGSLPDYVLPDLAAAVDFILEHHVNLLRDARPLMAKAGAGDIIVIGGQSRSGKSTLASALRELADERNLRAVVIHIDRWLQQSQRRTAGVMGRYDLLALERVMRLIQVSRRESVSIDLPIYDKLTRTSRSAGLSLELHPDDIVIVEGTIALGLNTFRFGGDIRVCVATPEPVRRERFVREYRRRGLTQDQAQALYYSRLEDEFRDIEAMTSGAIRVDFSGKTP
jgi:histidinol-phosphate phosphatase family protein